MSASGGPGSGEKELSLKDANVVVSPEMPVLSNDALLVHQTEQALQRGVESFLGRTTEDLLVSIHQAEKEIAERKVRLQEREFAFEERELAFEERELVCQARERAAESRLQENQELQEQEALPPRSVLEVPPRCHQQEVEAIHWRRTELARWEERLAQREQRLDAQQERLEQQWRLAREAQQRAELERRELQLQDLRARAAAAADLATLAAEDAAAGELRNAEQRAIACLAVQTQEKAATGAATEELEKTVFMPVPPGVGRVCSWLLLLLLLFFSAAHSEKAAEPEPWHDASKHDESAHTLPSRSPGPLDPVESQDQSLSFSGAVGSALAMLVFRRL